MTCFSEFLFPQKKCNKILTLLEQLSKILFPKQKLFWGAQKVTGERTEIKKKCSWPCGRQSDEDTQISS